MLASTMILAFGLVGRSTGYQTRREPPGGITLLINGEPRSGTTLLEKLVVGCMKVHCEITEACQMSVKSKVDIDEYVVSVSAWPGARRMASTALKHIVPNFGHRNGLDFRSIPSGDKLDMERAVGKTLGEMPQGGRYLTILRDPRDLLMSACHNQHGGCQSPDEFAKENMRAAVAWTSARFKFFQMLSAKVADNVLILFYEDLIVDFAGAVQQISQFLGTPLRQEASEQVALDVTALRTDENSTRSAPHACGFSRELSPLVIRNFTAMMYGTLPHELSAKWACGR